MLVDVMLWKSSLLWFLESMSVIALQEHGRYMTVDVKGCSKEPQTPE